MGLKSVKVSLDKGAYIPERAYHSDAGLDLRTPFSFIVPPKSRYAVDTGVHVEIPEGYVGFLKSKSGLNVNKGVLSEGVIDAGYSGSIVVCLYNQGDELVQFDEGSKITQLVILPVETPEVVIVNEIESLDRGSNGFGSTGK